VSIDLLNEDRLKELIEILQQAIETGYSLSSPIPADLLLEIMIDLCLKLRNQAREEGPWREMTNPTLEFLEKPLKLHSGARSGIWATTPDSLGNVAQKRRPERRETMTHPALSKFFEELAEMLIKLKRTHYPPRHLYCQEREERRTQPANKISHQTYWYWQRRKDHLKKHNTHHN